jgi:hypothetical protein
MAGRAGEVGKKQLCQWHTLWAFGFDPLIRTRYPQQNRCDASFCIWDQEISNASDRDILRIVRNRPNRQGHGRLAGNQAVKSRKRDLKQDRVFNGHSAKDSAPASHQWTMTEPCASADNMGGAQIAGAPLDRQENAARDDAVDTARLITDLEKLAPGLGLQTVACAKDGRPETCGLIFKPRVTFQHPLSGVMGFDHTAPPHAPCNRP